jgi:hypothetical protein
VLYTSRKRGIKGNNGLERKLQVELQWLSKDLEYSGSWDIPFSRSPDSN